MNDSVAERKRIERQRKKDQGLKRIEVWIKPKHEAGIRKFIRSLKDECEFCGYKFDAICGSYGCPNCLGGEFIA